MKDRKKKCRHGFTLWWNYGDGKPRHWSNTFDRPTMMVCTHPE